MNSTQHAALLRSITGLASRRGIIAGLASGLLATGIVADNVDEAEARKKGKRKNKKRKNKKNKNRQDDPKVRVDATCPNLGSIISSVTDGNFRFAQTFFAVRSGPLVTAVILSNKEPGSDGDFVLRLSPVDASGVPTNEVLAEASIASADAPDGVSTFTFAFSNPAPVVAGTEYALVLTRPGGTFVAWVGQSSAPCSGQRFFSNDQEKPFQPDPSGFDLAFTTFVKS